MINSIQQMIPIMTTQIWHLVRNLTQCRTRCVKAILNTSTVTIATICIFIFRFFVFFCISNCFNVLLLCELYLSFYVFCEMLFYFILLCLLPCLSWAFYICPTCVMCLVFSMFLLLHLFLLNKI